MGSLGQMVSDNTPILNPPPKRANIYSSFVMYQRSCRASLQEALDGSNPRVCITTLLLCPPLRERK